MIEKLLEERIIDTIKERLTANDINQDTIQIVGSLDVGGIKSQMESGNTSYIVVRVNPRSYSSPTIPECQIACDIALNVRADMDYSGFNYIDIMNILLSQLEKWQECMDDVHELFAIQDKFDVTGLQMGNGNTTVDANATMFGYQHSFTLFGVIHNLGNGCK